MLCDNVRMFPYLWKVQFQAITNEWIFPRLTGSEDTGQVLVHTCTVKEASPEYLWGFPENQSEVVRCTQKAEKHGFWKLVWFKGWTGSCSWFMEAEGLPQAESLHVTWTGSRCCLGGCCGKRPFLLYLFSFLLRLPLNDSRVDGHSVWCSPGSPALLCYYLSWNLQSE